MDVEPEPVRFGRVLKWTEFIANFLEEAGLVNALRGLREDLLVMSPAFEERVVPFAMRNLQIALLDNLVELPERMFSIGEAGAEQFRSETLKMQNGEDCSNKGKVNKEISMFLAENRARLNRSNRREFILNFNEKRARFFPGKENLTPSEEEMLSTSCARTEAKTQHRDVQIKFDIAKNEDGPLRKTVKPPPTLAKGEMEKSLSRTPNVTVPTFARHPGLVERFNNIEEHLALKYVPAPPFSLMERIRFIEEHIMKLEKEYPPWAALHFKQPRRGWPPPPTENSVIVPTHLTSSARPDASTSNAQSTETIEADPSTSVSKNPKPPKQRSSLHRAVMDKLDIQKALGDISGASTSNS